MRLRSTLTGFLAAFFLLVSCASSTCALACEINALPATHKYVQPQSAKSTVAHKTALDHCGHLVNEQSAHSIGTSDQPCFSSSQCDDKLCDHDQPASLTAGDFHLDQPHFVIATVSPNPGLKTVALETNATPSNLPHAPPKRFDVLRL